MRYLGKLLREHTTIYVLLSIFSIFISGKTLAEPISITIDDCHKIYKYLKSINDPANKKNHPSLLVSHIDAVSKKIFKQKEQKEQRIDFVELQFIFSHTHKHPNLPTKTVLPYTYQGTTWHFKPKRSLNHNNMKWKMKYIITLNFFLEILQKTEEEGCAEMHTALKLFMSTPQLQRFITHIKAECMHRHSIAITPPVEQWHPQANTGDSQHRHISENNPRHAYLPDQQQEHFATSPASSISATLTMEQDHTSTSPTPTACTEKDTDTQPLRLDLLPSTPPPKTISHNPSSQPEICYKKKNEKTLHKNDSSEKKCLFDEIPDPLSENISTLNIGDQNENKTPECIPSQSTDITSQCAYTSTLEHKENTTIKDILSQENVASTTINIHSLDNTLENLSIHSPNGKNVFSIISTKAKIVDTENILDKNELDFFFENVSVQPKKLWADDHKNHLREITYIQKIAVFAKGNDQNTKTEFRVHLKNDDQCINKIMSLCNTNTPEKIAKKHFIIPSTHTTAHLKYHNNITSKTSQCFYIVDPHTELNVEFLRKRYSVVCAAATDISRHQFSMLAKSLDIDTSHDNTYGTKLPDNYLAIAKMCCILTNWKDDIDIDEDEDEDEDDYNMEIEEARNIITQDISGIKCASPAGKYKIIKTDDIVKRTKYLDFSSPVIYIIHVLDLSPDNQEDIQHAISFLEHN
ncbi:MAG: hypothetical protein QS748_11830 [Candidatus Endonucleobacter bathymodioli]|uniref:Uncharacterized protein n=1 Tax=Candidatus Endonucleibacter bathymodioli TaxID=539814 RepID=A0AA90NNF9_9GAMM|nr:hypothetical protein [Candidatus Endonucleobacter bathymodioli]